MRFKDEVTRKLVDILLRQEQSGLDTYGKTLADCPDEDYDWKIMAIEELIDAPKYLIKEVMRLEKRVKELEEYEWKYKELSK